ncbi:DUF4179 domain-containing protein [Tenuibacillus multivorans]|uniref:DUF4179 domain-containing protein n=1 Tax=Tenuibacillus multivorans TaxID=237069 RepID=A0A1G9Y9A5_9BACI|nr:DUF4179 domain-containing protein [Tenuibacillus multivorans]GEL76002.1 hypothetical protein TMU01_02370 [Tenuibacillus multivorans]SDN05692.1 protein of unknown function [Tenuibacillus multivorans]
MKDSIEHELEKWKEEYQEFDSNLDKIDAAIDQGFQKAKQKGSKLKPVMMTAITTAAVLLFGFIAIINFSPRFQEQVSQVPGINKIVELISQDKGLETAYDHDYYEPIGMSQKQGDYELTIDGVIRDQHGLIVFYTIKSDESKRRLYLGDISITDSNGERLPGGSSSYGSPEKGDNNEFSGTYKYFSQEPIKAKQFVFNAKLSPSNGIHFSIPFEAQKNPDPIQYDINEEVTVQGQSILIESIDIHPTRTAVQIQYDASNDMKIFGIEDMRLVDGSGEEWGGISNGTTRTGPDDEGYISYYLESNYFDIPDELYLEFSKLQALPKDEAYLKLDLDQDKILFDPYNQFVDFEYESHGYLTLSMKANEEFYSVPFGQVINESGNEIETNHSHGTTEIVDGEERDTYGQSIERTEGIVTVELSAYPHWIEEPVRIKIK